MALSTDGMKQFKQGLATAQRRVGEIGTVQDTVTAARSLTPDLVAQLGEIGLPQLFALDTAPQTGVFPDRFGEVTNQLAKSRTGRLAPAAEALTSLLDAMQRTPVMNPATGSFWESYFGTRDRADDAALDGFAAELAAGYGVVRMVLTSELTKRLAANGLGHVPAPSVTERLGFRGISVVDDIPVPAVTALQQTGTNVVGLIRPQGGPHPAYTLAPSARPGVTSVYDLTASDVESALTWCDARGAEKATWKKALAALKPLVTSERPLGVVLTAYHLQLVAVKRDQGMFAGAVRSALVADGLEEEDAARLLNETLRAPGAYPWAGVSGGAGRPGGSGYSWR